MHSNSESKPNAQCTHLCFTAFSVNFEACVPTIAERIIFEVLSHESGYTKTSLTLWCC